MKQCRRRNRRTQLFLNGACRWGRVAGFITRPHYTQTIYPLPSNWWQVETEDVSGYFGEEDICYPRGDLYPEPSVIPHSLVTISTELPSAVTSDTSNSLCLLCKWASSYTIFFFFQNVTTKCWTAFRTLMESKGVIFFNVYFVISYSFPPGATTPIGGCILQPSSGL